MLPSSVLPLDVKLLDQRVVDFVTQLDLKGSVYFSLLNVKGLSFNEEDTTCLSGDTFINHVLVTLKPYIENVSVIILGEGVEITKLTSLKKPVFSVEGHSFERTLDILNLFSIWKDKLPSARISFKHDVTPIIALNEWKTFPHNEIAEAIKLNFEQATAIEPSSKFVSMDISSFVDEHEGARYTLKEELKYFLSTLNDRFKRFVLTRHENIFGEPQPAIYRLSLYGSELA